MLDTRIDWRGTTVLSRRRRPGHVALETPSLVRLWWWRRTSPRAGGYARPAIAVAIVAVAVAVAIVRGDSYWPPRYTVNSSCFPFQATVPLTWRVVTTGRAAEACSADAGSFVLRVPSNSGPMYLTVEREGRALTADVLRLLDYERGSRSGLTYTFVSETSKVQSAIVISDGVVYVIRCEQGIEGTCHEALMSLLDGSRFSIPRPPT